MSIATQAAAVVCSPEDLHYIDRIASRAKACLWLGPKQTEHVKNLLTLCHCNSQPLNLKLLADCETQRFENDINGIWQHADHATGALRLAMYTPLCLLDRACSEESAEWLLANGFKGCPQSFRTVAVRLVLCCWKAVEVVEGFQCNGASRIAYGLRSAIQCAQMSGADDSDEGDEYAAPECVARLLKALPLFDTKQTAKLAKEIRDTIREAGAGRLLPTGGAQ